MREGVTAQIDVRKGPPRSNLTKNAFVTVFSTRAQAQDAARDKNRQAGAAPAKGAGVEVAVRGTLMFEVDEGSGEDINAIISAAGY